VPWTPAADGPQATVGPQFWFQVKEEVRTGFWACARLAARRSVMMVEVVRGIVGDG